MIRYIKGDIFSHKGSGTVILAHACNPFGIWGEGIAAQFRKRYPHAHELYAEHCQKHNDLLGSCLIIPTKREKHPSEADTLIACLFTSDFNCSKDDILKYTRLSINSLLYQVGEFKGENKIKSLSTVINMPQINSGIFNVPWEMTEAILEENEEVFFNIYYL